MRYQEQELADSGQDISVIQIGQSEPPDAEVSCQSCFRNFSGQASP
jgi:hypothetical protein